MLIIHESLGKKSYSQKLDGYYFQKFQQILGSCANVALIVFMHWTNQSFINLAVNWKPYFFSKMMFSKFRKYDDVTDSTIRPIFIKCSTIH